MQTSFFLILFISMKSLLRLNTYLSMHVPSTLCNLLNTHHCFFYLTILLSLSLIIMDLNITLVWFFTLLFLVHSFLSLYVSSLNKCWFPNPFLSLVYSYFLMIKGIITEIKCQPEKMEQFASDKNFESTPDLFLLLAMAVSYLCLFSSLLLYPWMDFLGTHSL